ncbi:MAG TPA: sugar ABC transporter ATP-binding protein [Candidatus Pullichristensenella excrementigallinarum]|uniref:Sugar ABC transporter ATP-binding protein n=1 Tax=Candidatus Pullichristensenella excrementigallinarum TaxID=2840907 RepID=A0A9D1LBY4_9FIRM|nr:sugar ABC transporter ATP-binding protein [Candidatus Pullichristensenella excrementigallinarum]
MPNTLLRMEDIEKRFPGVHALKKACLELKAGEVLGLMGENGAGKSTLMNVLSGIFPADSGRIFIDEKEVFIRSVADAQAQGIAFIHQELALEPHLSLAENIFMGREITGSLGFVSQKAMNREAVKYLRIVGLEEPPGKKVIRLSIGQQQMLEIAKAFSLNARILVMDEPTSSLSEKEVQILFSTIRDLKARGIGIIYISHKMQEIFEITDRVSVMRDGSYIGTRITSQTNSDELVQMMVGRELEQYYVRTYNEPGKVMLEAKNICRGDIVRNCSFQVRAGEILGFYGLVGAGRTELMQTIMGLDPITGGEVTINGVKTQKPTPKLCREQRMVLVPEDRKLEGLILEKDIMFNTSIPVLGQIISKLRVNHKKEIALAEKVVRDFSVKASSIRQKTLNLSGGNQQKVVIGKWLLTDPSIIIMDEPTRGIDVGAKAEIYAIMNQLVSQGIAIIMISSELNEILNMCDRLCVMNRGTIVAQLERADFVQDTILHYALGGANS